MRVSEGISGPVREVVWRVDSGSILGQFWTHSRPYLGNLIHIPRFTLHLAVGRALRLKYDEYEGPEGWWVVPGIALPDPPSHPIPRVHLPWHGSPVSMAPHGSIPDSKCVVGL